MSESIAVLSKYARGSVVVLPLFVGVASTVISVSMEAIASSVGLSPPRCRRRQVTCRQTTYG